MKARTRFGAFFLAIAGALAALLFLAPSARAAALDFVPDAVVGKPSFTAGANGVVSATNMLWVSAIAEDPISGELWVVDHFGSRVLRFASAHAFTNGEAANLVLGQPDFVSDRANRGGAVAANTLNRPVGVAVDEARRVYVSDMENNRILVFHPPFANGMDARQVIGQGVNFTTAAPNAGAGVDGPNAGGLHRPHGLAFDPFGRLWVADLANARVLRMGPNLGTVSLSPDRVIGQSGLNSQTVSLTAAGLSQPAGIAFDRLGGLWVADQAFHRVTLYSRADRVQDGEAASVVLCQPDFTSALAGSGSGSCFMPTTLAFDDAGRILVGDFGNSRILDFPADVPLGGPAEGVIGQPDFEGRDCNRGAAAPTLNALCGPRALLLDSHANLLVADAGNGRVLRYDIPRDRVAPVVGAKSPDTLVPGPQGAELSLVGSFFRRDTTVTVGGAARPVRYLSTKRIQVTLQPGDLSAVGNLALAVTTPAPGGGQANTTVTVRSGSAGDRAADRFLGRGGLSATAPAAGGALSGTINAALMREPVAMAIDSATGRLFVADAGWGRVMSWPSYAAFQNAQAADVIIGAPDAMTIGDSLPVSARSLDSPRGLALDAAGRLYVSDTGNSRILRFDPPFTTGMAASGVLGQGGSFTTFLIGTAANRLYQPQGLAFAGSRLVVADAGNNRVLVFDDPATDAASVVLGQIDMASDMSRLGRSGMDYPTEVAVDAAGRAYVSDSNNNRVLRFTPPFANGMAADLVIGQPDFDTSDGYTTPDVLNTPRGLAVDAEGNLVVADRYNSRVLRFTAPLANGMAASGLLGQADFVSGNDGAGSGEFFQPTGVALDPSGNVLVADTGNRRLLAFDRPFGVETSKRLVNIATRMPVLQGDDVLIGGFIIGGTAPKKVVVRARGPSLGAFGIANPLANPLLQLFSGANAIAANDNWQQAANVAEIQASGFAPAHPFESAILMTLEPGAYTAIVSGAGGVTGVGIVEVFEVDGAASPLVNIATRGRVLTGDDVLIGGFVISGDSPQTVVIRARGPSLAAAGVPNPLANPLLRLFAGDGTALLTNDDWTVAPNAVAIQASGFVPSDARESAILVTLNPGAYTAVVSGVGGTTGLAIVEVFVP